MSPENDLMAKCLDIVNQIVTKNLKSYMSVKIAVNSLLTFQIVNLFKRSSLLVRGLGILKDKKFLMQRKIKKTNLRTSLYRLNTKLEKLVFKLVTSIRNLIPKSIILALKPIPKLQAQNWTIQLSHQSQKSVVKQ